MQQIVLFSNLKSQNALPIVDPELNASITIPFSNSLISCKLTVSMASII